MAKKDLATVEEANTEVVGYGDYGSDGFEDVSSNDLSIPFVNVLQTNSPEVENQTVPGAVAGAFLNSVTQEIIPGDMGFVFVPCHRDEQWVEWVPRNKGGGFVASHDPLSDVVQELLRANNNSRIPPKDQDGKRKPFRHNGNEVVETSYMYGLMMDLTGQVVHGFSVLSFSSTKIKPFRDWTTAMYMLRVNNQRPPIFANRALIRSIRQKNNDGSFFNLSISPLDGTWLNSLIHPQKDAAILQAAMDFREMIMSGVAKADMSGQGSNEAPEGSDTPF